VILIGTGSEVALCVQARDTLQSQGVRARVVSLPSWELFGKQDAAYQESVLPKAVRKRVTVEAGATLGWSRFAGDEGVVIGLDRYGASAPGGEVLQYFGFTADRVTTAALGLLSRTKETA